MTRELRDLIAADQNGPLPPNLPQDPVERERVFRAHWEKRFKPRRDRALQIMQAGRLQSAEDYEIAGTLLNHSAYSDDHLVAHLLFTTAAHKGSRIARWYSATALDNYLMATQKRQLFGTLWGEPDNPDKDRSSVMGTPMTDALRNEFCVPSVAQQTFLLEHLRKGDRETWRREKVLEDCR